MRLSDLAKQGHLPKGENPEDKEGKSPEEDSRKKETPFENPPQEEEKPFELPAEEDRISLRQILESHAPDEEPFAIRPAEEAPLDMNLILEEDRPSPLPESKPGPHSPASPPQQGTLAPLSRKSTGGPARRERHDKTAEPAFPASRTLGSPQEKPLYDALVQTIVELFQQVSKKKRIKLDSFIPLINEMTTEGDKLEELYRLSLTQRGGGNALSEHLVNVGVFSVKIGIGMRFPPPKLRQLALAALLHDIGMCLIPSEVRYRKGKLTPQEISLIQRHPEYGYQVVKAHLGDEYQWLAETIREEHERENGSGYPNGLTAEEIGEFAKIIAVCDVYEAITHDRPHRPRLLPYRAVKEIMEKQKGVFSPTVLKAMLQQLSVFPLNSLVRLNSNTVARVVETHEGQPLRPTVQMVYDPKGDYLEAGRVISLRENPLLYIVDSMDESEFN